MCLIKDESSFTGEVSRILQLNNEYDIDALLNLTKNTILNSLDEKKEAKSKIYKGHSDNSVKIFEMFATGKTEALYQLDYTT